MEIADAAPFLANHSRGVLATIRRDGRPQLSNVVYGWIDGAVEISATASRAKTRNLERDPRGSLHVTSEDFWQYVVIDGEAELGPVAKEPGDDALRSLRRLYEHISGPHPDWDDYDRAMIADERLVVRLHPVHVYGMGI